MPFDELLSNVVTALQGVGGIRGIVLGGSRARGNADLDSDVDIGIYYDAAELDLPALDAAAAVLDDEGRKGLVAPPGDWGEWVDGGAWLTIGGVSVDLVLRDVERVKRCIAECREGIVTRHYQPGHPHAYLNAMYVGELAVCKVLRPADPGLAGLKRLAEAYPPLLKKELLHLFTFEAGFSAALAAKNQGRGDVYYVAAHIARSLSCVNQALFALNETYLLNEKKAVRMAGALPITLPDYPARVERVFALLGEDVRSACDVLAEIVEETSRVAEASR